MDFLTDDDINRLIAWENNIRHSEQRMRHVCELNKDDINRLIKSSEKRMRPVCNLNKEYEIISGCNSLTDDINNIGSRKNSMRPVCELNKKGKIINRWNSLTEASYMSGINKSTLSKRCRNKITVNGRIFRYEDDISNENYPNEIWKKLDSEKFYSIYISNYGRVKNLKGRIMNQVYKSGKYYVNIRRKNSVHISCTTISVDKLVAEAFLGASYLNIIHKDGDSTNNKLENIMYFK